MVVVLLVFIATLARRVPLMGQTLLTLPEHLSSFPVFSDVRVAHICFCVFRLFVFIAHSVVFSVVFCTSLFVLLSFFCWTLGCLSFDLRLLNKWFYLETQATLGTRHRQHWAQDTHNIGHKTQATLGTRHRQHWHKTQSKYKQNKKIQHRKLTRCLWIPPKKAVNLILLINALWHSLHQIVDVASCSRFDRIKHCWMPCGRNV